MSLPKIKHPLYTITIPSTKKEIQMSKLGNREIPMTLTEDNVLKIAVAQGVMDPEYNWKWSGLGPHHS